MPLALVAVQVIAVVAMDGDYMTDVRLFAPVLAAFFYVAIGRVIDLRPVTLVVTALFVGGHVCRITSCNRM